MKLATYADGTRDGHLVVVSHDLASAVYANTQASRLQQLLDDWNFVAPQLQELYITLNHGKARHSFAFDPALCQAPLPRMGHWAWQALGAQTEPSDVAPTSAAGSEAGAGVGPLSGRSGWTRPLLQAEPGDDMRGPCAELALPNARWPGGVNAGLAVLTGELALEAGPTQALESVRLLGVYSRWTLASSDPTPSTRVSPVADGTPAPHWAPLLVTPDELGPAWVAGRVDLELQLQWLCARGLQLGATQRVRGADQRWHYGQLLAWACRARRLRAGSGVGCDWLSARLPRPQDLAVDAGLAPAPAGRAARRVAGARGETAPVAESGRPIGQGPAYAARLEVFGADGQSVFGALTPAWSQAEEPVGWPSWATTAPAPAPAPAPASSAAAAGGAPAADSPAALDPAQAATELPAGPAEAGEAARQPAPAAARKTRTARARAGGPAKGKAGGTIDAA
ncbi:MAG: fumarylacetoacetate hydrolase [Pseudomonadota bacterium]|jgi:fumarylacetoacetate (FAA) hydrolase